MRVQGTYHFPAPRQQVFDLLLDPVVLQRCIPGCERLEEVGEGHYEATLKIGVAAIRGTYKGQVRLSDQVSPESYRMAIEGKGGPGFVKGVATITLAEAGEGCDVKVDGDGQLGGPMAGVAQRLLGGVTNMMMNQFFECMKGQLASAAA